MGLFSWRHWIRGLGRPTAARLSRWRATAARVIARSEQFAALSDDELLRRAREVRWQVRTGVPPHKLLVEAYALVRESARRTAGMQHYPVQIMGGIALFEGHVAEMQTGEGKTLTATLPVFLRALAGHGCHVVTVNDYLAARDTETMGPIYRRLGLTVGCIQTPMKDDERRTAYAQDVTYGTAKEMGFDFLRDRLRRGTAGPQQGRRTPLFGEASAGGDQPVQRGHYFALVDEADSVLIDEARTPLVIGLMQPHDEAAVGLFRWSDAAAGHLDRGADFLFDPQKRAAFLTDAGCRRVLLMSKPPALDAFGMERIYLHVERALTARWGLVRDRDYVVVNDEVTIVDESTGRLMDGRKWQEGLHQAVEAREQVPITANTGHAARITVQSYFRQYTHLAGMTGTAVAARRELKSAYRLKVTPIPTHRPCVRTGRPPRVFATAAAKREAAADEIVRLLEAGRAVLVGTPSVAASEALGEVLAGRGRSFQILNARFLEREAEIVSRAGQPGQVTIATNMAGRGTDIELHDTVRQSGGLHVLATEMHSSARIDRQLIGRAARQGDPGSYQFVLSLEDELLRVLKPEVLARLRRRARPDARGELPCGWQRVFGRTQRMLERLHARQRKQLLRHEKTRSDAYRKMGLDHWLELTET